MSSSQLLLAPELEIIACSIRARDHHHPLPHFDGRKINDTLVPYTMVIVPVHLDKAELEINMSVMDQITGSSLAAAMDDNVSFNTKFYLDGRTKVAFPRHTSPIYPTVKSLEEWDMVRSTRVDTLVTLLAWNLESDNQTTFNIEDGNTNTVQGADLQTAVNVEEPTASAPDANLMDQSDGYVPQQSNKTIAGKVNARYVEMLDLMTMGTRKILVYMEFPMMGPLLVSVLQLYNIVTLIINGGHGIEERNETVQKFITDPAARILIFSNVGAVGLNLTAASIVILFDQCWSRMLVNQIIGRAWRLGQTQGVLVYNMVALGTVDVLMVDHGERKGNMLGQFLSANKGVVTTIKNAAAGHLPVADADDDDEVEIVDTPAPVAGSSKSQKKVTKGSKKQTTCNVVQMGDNDGEFLDINSIVLDEVKEQRDSEDKATATHEGKGKAKPQANASVTNKTEPKPEGKGKATADGELSDVERSHSVEFYIRASDKSIQSAATTVTASKNGLIRKPVTETATPTEATQGSKETEEKADDLQGEPLAETASNGDSAQRQVAQRSLPSSGAHNESPAGDTDAKVTGTTTLRQPQDDQATTLSVAESTAEAQITRSPEGAVMQIDDPAIGSCEASDTNKGFEDTIEINHHDTATQGENTFLSHDEDFNAEMDLGSMQHCAQDGDTVDHILQEQTQSAQPGIAQISQPMQDLGAAFKRRHSKVSPEQSQRKSPPFAPPPPRKKVNFNAKSPESSTPTGAGGNAFPGSSKEPTVLLHQSAVPDDAPVPRRGRPSARGLPRGHGLRR
ncbi:hypothetical protein F4604DRAFT_1935109 [Suillus subluteus]|nr:hypothetical protein F4604DRAFT_1935109 [Suillus subluteus]